MREEEDTEKTVLQNDVMKGQLEMKIIHSVVSVDGRHVAFFAVTKLCATIRLKICIISPSSVPTKSSSAELLSMKVLYIPFSRQ